MSEEGRQGPAGRRSPPRGWAHGPETGVLLFIPDVPRPTSGWRPLPMIPLPRVSPLSSLFPRMSALSTPMGLSPLRPRAQPVLWACQGGRWACSPGCPVCPHLCLGGFLVFPVGTLPRLAYGEAARAPSCTLCPTVQWPGPRCAQICPCQMTTSTAPSVACMWWALGPFSHQRSSASLICVS